MFFLPAVRGSLMGNDRGRGRKRQDWFGGDGRSGNFSGSDGNGRDRSEGPGGRDRGPRDRRDNDRGRPQYRGRPQVEQTREVVLPGDLLAHGRSVGGPGTYTENGVVYAAQLGVRTFQEGKVSVLPLGGRYMPVEGDEVVGKVQDVNPNYWLVDINAPYPAPLHVDESPWQVPLGETARYLAQGDIVVVRVQTVDVVKRTKLTMKDGRGLRKLAGGMALEVSPSKVPRVIGKGGSMISMIKDMTRCMILVGQNGRVWIDGEPDMIVLAAEAITMIDRNAQQSGLTDTVEAFLENRTRRGR
jgi:exosome complex component RRP4